MNSCDFVSALFGGIIEGKLGNASGFLSGDYLQTLNYPWNTLKKPKNMPFIKQPFLLYIIIVRINLYLMLQGAVLSFSLFADYHEVQVIVASAVAWEAVYMNHIRKKV